MWELSRLTSRGGLSVRRIFTYVFTAFIAAFLWVIFSSSLTHAADATWSGALLQYDGNSYTGPVDAKTVKALGLLDGTKAYTYVEPAPTSGSTSVSRKMFVIYFASDVDSSVATGAKYKTYIYQGPSSFTDPSNPVDITLSQQTASTQGTSSCTVDGGLGWIICPITNTLSTAMDWVFNVLSGFLSVRPVQTGQENALYRAWTYMRSFANVAFLIAFIIIIYSQLTSLGISNYGIKKLLPRLIIAALLVNVSYYICAIAIDVSNVLGYSIQDIFVSMRNSLVGAEGNSWNVISWQSISGFILSGGTAAIAGGIGAVSVISTYGIVGSVFLLLPALVTGLVAVLVALLVMAARQAIITILVILAPLAFVAYLLPNTEKWFNKWRETLTTMLILFPAFSVVFGGSQLAASAIIQNADSINLIILGMLVQVAPLFITPLLIRLSGSLLGKIAGLVNNPNKGIIDRTRKYAEDRAGNRKEQRLGTTARPGIFGAAQRNAQRVDHNRRRRELQKKIHGNLAENRFLGSAHNSELHEQMHTVETDKEIIENGLKQHIQTRINTRGSQLHLQNLKLEDSKSRLDEALKETETVMKEYESGKVKVTGEIDRLTRSIRVSNEAIALSGMRKKSAQDVVDASFAKKFIAREDLQIQAGGVGGAEGAKIALANAIATQDKGYGENVAAAKSINSHFKLTVEQKFQHANGQVVVGTDSDGIARTFHADDVFTRDAAVTDTLKSAPYGMGAEIIANSFKPEFAAFRGTIVAAMEEANWESRAGFYDGDTRDKIRQGLVDENYLKQRAAEYIVSTKLSPERMVTTHRNALKLIYDVAEEMRAGTITVDPKKFAPSLGGSVDAAIDKLKSNANASLTSEATKNRVGDQGDMLEEMRTKL